MTTTFEQRLAEAINAAVVGITHRGETVTADTIAARLIATGAVADPIQHQADLTAIMEKQHRDAEAWTDEYITTSDPNDERPDVVAVLTDAEPDWDDEIPTYHRKATTWRKITRKA